MMTLVEHSGSLCARGASIACWFSGCVEIGLGYWTHVLVSCSLRSADGGFFLFSVLGLGCMYCSLAFKLLFGGH